MSRAFRTLMSAVVGAVAGCSAPAPQQPPPPVVQGGCVHQHELPPLHLTDEQTALLARVSPVPKTALDYYMRVPKAWFSIMPDSKERRVTYIRPDGFSDDYLHAWRWFECDGGGFEMALKVFHTPAGDRIVIKRETSETLYDNHWVVGGEPSVSLLRPVMWSYAGGRWHRQPDEAVPAMALQAILAKYHHDWDSDHQYTDQKKFIYVDYVLSPSTNDIVLMGRENFQSGIYEYGRLKWNGTRFMLHEAPAKSKAGAE